MSEGGEQQQGAGDGFDALVEGAAPDAEDTRRTVEQLAEDCHALVALGRYDAAIAAANEVIIRLEVPSDPVLCALCDRAELGLAGALRGQGLALIAGDRPDEGIALLGYMIERMQDDLAPELRREVALTRGAKMIALMGCGRGDEAFAVRDELLRDYGEEGLRVIELTGVRL